MTSALRGLLASAVGQTSETRTRHDSSAGILRREQLLIRCGYVTHRSVLQ